MKQKKLLLYLLWFVEGIVVGFGAILPGISGGTLCVAFGMYRPIIYTISHIKSGLRQYGLMLITFICGAGAGFVGLSGLAAWMLERNTALITCVFIGFILGTFPELWQDAGSKGRSKSSLVTMTVSFVIMLTLLALLKTKFSICIAPGIFGFLLCGILWGLSFIVPGLSSSSLLLFFGLYQPMLEGISRFDFSVLVPLAIGMGVCVLLLSGIIEKTYEKHFSMMSHGILGIVAATAVMIFPAWDGKSLTILFWAIAIIGGFALSYGFTRLCANIKKNAED